jgi:succinyl-diaminopimelate desuccinylase
VPAVEFGPIGGGHHGPEEWVSIDSLQRYRRALSDFVTGLPGWLAAMTPAEGKPPLRAVDGWRA